jgi:hypothetical protein
MRRQRETQLNKTSNEGGMMSDLVDLSEAKLVRKAFGFAGDDELGPQPRSQSRKKKI